MDKSIYESYQIKPVEARVESPIRSLSNWRQDFVNAQIAIHHQMFEAKEKHSLESQTRKLEIERLQLELGLESKRLQLELNLENQRSEQEMKDLNLLERAMVADLTETAEKRIDELYASCNHEAKAIRTQRQQFLEKMAKLDRQERDIDAEIAKLLAEKQRDKMELETELRHIELEQQRIELEREDLDHQELSFDGNPALNQRQNQSEQNLAPTTTPQH